MSEKKTRTKKSSIPDDPKTQEELDQALKRLGKQVKERCVSENEPSVARKAPKAKTLEDKPHFPSWAEHLMGVPNELVRCALFAAVDDRETRLLKHEVIAAQGDTTVIFSGGQLTQTHLDVFEGIVHFYREKNEGDRVSFSGYELLRRIDRHIGAFEYKWLHRKMVDLTTCAVTIVKKGKRRYSDTLIHTPKTDEITGICETVVSSNLINLFEMGFTRVQWEQRFMLKQKPLACWLQMYYCTHSKPFPVKVDFIRKQSGSRTAELRDFRPLLKAALNEIQKVGVIDSWEITDDSVTVAKRRQKLSAPS